jgi:hypothetical protein
MKMHFDSPADAMACIIEPHAIHQASRRGAARGDFRLGVNTRTLPTALDAKVAIAMRQLFTTAALSMLVNEGALQ